MFNSRQRVSTTAANSSALAERISTALSRTCLAVVLPVDGDGFHLGVLLDGLSIGACAGDLIYDELSALDLEKSGVFLGCVCLEVCIGCLLGIDADNGHVGVSDSECCLPLDVLLGGSHNSMCVDQNGLGVGQLHNGNVFIFDLEGRVSEGHEVAGEDGPGTDLVQTVHDGTAGATYSTT